MSPKSLVNPSIPQTRNAEHQVAEAFGALAKQESFNWNLFQNPASLAAPATPVASLTHSLIAFGID
jgi:hypothetical protein